MNSVSSAWSSRNVCTPIAFSHKRLDTDLVVVGLVFIGDRAPRTAAPDSRDCGMTGSSRHVVASFTPR